MSSHSDNVNKLIKDLKQLGQELANMIGKEDTSATRDLAVEITNILKEHKESSVGQDVLALTMVLCMALETIVKDVEEKIQNQDPKLEDTDFSKIKIF